METIHIRGGIWYRCNVIIIMCIAFLSASFITKDKAKEKLHAFHISKTDMTHKDKSLQITMHVFIDDLELGLEKQGHKKLFVGTEREVSGVNELIIKYLQQNFSIKINNKATAYEWIGKETASDKQALWIYLEAKNIKSINQIFVENKVLTEVFNDQKNIVQVNIPSKKQGYFLLDKTRTSESANF